MQVIVSSVQQRNAHFIVLLDRTSLFTTFNKTFVFFHKLHIGSKYRERDSGAFEQIKSLII